MRAELILPSRFFERFYDYLELCKPRVVLLMILTSIVGMCLASSIVTPLSWVIFIFGNLGIALMAGSAAAINHLMDRRIDQLMCRTANRPVAQGKISTQQASIFSGILCVLGLFILIYYVNALTAYLTFLTLIGYAVIYTLYLKYQTSQNIVIGGFAGAAPPLLGWVAVTNHIDPGALVLLLIIFAWTPPHFWALAIYRVDEYAKAKVPMLPITHSVGYTKLNILLYTVLLSAISVLPFVIKMSSWIYLYSVIFLDLYFIFLAIKLMRTDNPVVAMGVFKYSIIYLLLLFVALLVDHYIT